MYRLIAMTWSRVLILPPRLAAITPRRITQNRSAVTASSRATMTTVTHQASSPRIERVTRAEPVRALSAMGSAIFPKSVIRLRRRASSPSRQVGHRTRPRTRRTNRTGIRCRRSPGTRRRRGRAAAGPRSGRWPRSAGRAGRPRRPPAGAGVHRTGHAQCGPGVRDSAAALPAFRPPSWLTLRGPPGALARLRGPPGGRGRLGPGRRCVRADARLRQQRLRRDGLGGQVHAVGAGDPDPQQVAGSRPAPVTSTVPSTSGAWCGPRPRYGRRRDPRRRARP